MIYKDIPVKTMGIYKINFPNGKIYIGRAIDIKRRIWEHYAKKDYTICQDAIYKYFSSYEDIDIDILETFDIYDFEIIKQREKFWIKKYKSFEDKTIGYNRSEGGDGGDLGINNPAASFNAETIEQVYSLLQKGYPNQFIADQFGVHPDTIGRINQGKSYYNENLIYPIRAKDNKQGFHSGAAKTEQCYQKIVELLKNTTLSRSEISKQTGASVNVISQINQGKHFYCKDLNISFPIQNKSRRSKKLTEEEIINIKYDLKFSKMSIIKIAEKYQCSRDTVGDINNGKIHKDNINTYPLRNKSKSAS